MKTRNNKEVKKDDNPDLAIRSATIEISKRADGESDIVNMSISSEEPVLCACYYNDSYMRAYEILDHSPTSINQSRMKDGLVVLDRHYGDQIGLMRVEINNRKMTGPVEFCSGQRAQEISKDAAKGLRRNVSIGYTVDASSYRLEGEKDGIPVIRAMSWTPYEASFEPIPADTTVGVNRADKTLTEKTKSVEKKENTMDPKEIAKLFERAAQFGIAAAEVTKLIDAGKGRSELDSMIVEKQSKDIEVRESKIKELETRKPDVAPAVAPVDPIGGSKEAQEKVLRKYSVMNVLRSIAGQAVDIGFEREMSDELAKQRGKPAQGIIIPHAALAKRDFTVSGTSSASVSTDLMAGEFIDLLRSKSILGEAGVTFLTGLVGNVAIPKMSAGATGYWVAESGDITESQPTLGQVTGSPHTCGVMTDISRRLLLQSTPSAEMMVRDEIVQRIIRTIQIAVFAGTGADGQPSAITNASGINNPSVTQGTPTYAELLNFPGSIMADNAEADGQKWIMTAEVWAKLAATMRTATYGDIPVLDIASKTCLGFPYLTTEDVPANSLWFGAWNSVVVGVWGNGIDINADTATLSSSGGLRLVGLQDVDVMVRIGQALAYNTAVTA